MSNYLTQIFINCIHIGYQAGIAVIVVILARAFLNKIHVPKKYICFLWFIPFIRLALPVLPQSIFSIFRLFSFLPKQAETALALLSSTNRTPVILSAAGQPAVSTGSEFMSQIVRQSLPAAASEAGINPLRLWLFVLAVVWIVGVVFLFLYGITSVIFMKKKLRTSICEYENIYLADGIFTAFVMGVYRTRIYLPSDISEDIREYVICHEKQHIKRKDHIIKIVFFILTCIYWFHPLIWAAYILANKDIEFACDEAVIKSKSLYYREKYAEALLSLSVGRKSFMLVSPAFSEGSPKKRIKHIMSYKNPIFLVGIIGIAVIALLTVGLLTKPVNEPVINQAEMREENIEAEYGKVDEIKDTTINEEAEEIKNVEENAETEIIDMDTEMYVAVAALRYRENHDFGAQTLGLLGRGDKVKITGITADKKWYRAWMEEEGIVYISADYLSMEEPDL